MCDKMNSILNRFTQGETLMLLVHRSKKTASEVCAGLEINPSHLSRLYRSELLTENIRRRAAKFFQVPESVFKDGEVGEGKSVVNEPPARYEAMKRDVEGMTAAEVLRYLEEKDKRHHSERLDKDRQHYEERGRLLAIIEQLTKTR